MKKSLKCLSVILVMLITLFSFSITALAQTTEQDGLQVSLTTNKQSYSLNEDIEITVSVTNTNDFTVEDVSIEALLPDNFELKDSKQNTSAKAVDLKAGEQTSLFVIAVVKGQEENPTEPSAKPDDTTKPTESTTDNKNNQNTNTIGQTTTNNNDNNKSDKADKNTNTKNNKNGTSPYTGADYTFMGIFLVLFLASVSTLFYCLIKRFKKTTKIVSSVLCAVIAVTSVIGFSTFNAFAQEDKSTVAVSEQIKVDNIDYTITANVNYKINDNINLTIDNEQETVVNFNQKLSGKFSLASNVVSVTYTIATEIDDYEITDSGNALIYGNTYSADIQLKPQINKITVTATTESGKTENKTVKITYDSGKIYELDENHIAYDSETNTHYVDNIVLIFFEEGVSDDRRNEIVSSINGKVVGSINGVNQWQVEVLPTDYKNLKLICDNLEQIDSVFSAHIDKISKISPDISINDPYKNADGGDWYLDAIDAYSAWNYNERFNYIDIGVVDNGFDIGHEDLEGVIKFPNEEFKSKNKKAEHGTHVAGIIGANANNKKGMTGLVWKNKLWCVDWQPQGSQEWDTTNEILSGLTYTVEAGAKVVNFSLGQTESFSYSELQSPAYSINETLEDARISADTMVELLEKGKDFIVVQSVGNGSSDGYAVNAITNGLFSSITEFHIKLSENSKITKNDVLDRIIIVGAAQKNDDGNYQQAVFSNGGKQVDICAPGTNIYSTVPGKIGDGWINGTYVNKNGTSMAAPMVTSVCGMVWSVNSRFTGAEVKDIVCNSYDENIWVWDNPDGKHTTNDNYRMLNAKLSVEEAIRRTDGTGNIIGRVKEQGTNAPISNREVKIYNEFYTSDNAMYTFVDKTKTNSNGSFKISLPAGIYTLVIDNDGENANSGYYYDTVEMKVKVDAGVDTVLLNDIILARRENGITGYVYDHDDLINNGKNTPIADVTVEVYQNNNGTTDYIGKCKTDENGKYTFAVDKNGSYDLSFIKSGYEDKTENMVFVNGGFATRDVYLTKGNSSSDNVKFAGGNGTEANPYQVSIPEQLNAVRNDLSAHYIQINDIDMSNWGNWEPIGDKDNPFTGKYNGDNYNIKGLSIKESTCKESKTIYIGLFGYAKNSIIGSIKITNSLTDANSTYDGHDFKVYCSIIVGCGEKTNITNCTVDDSALNAKITSGETEVYIGGVAGCLLTGEIENCMVNNKIYIDSNSSAWINEYHSTVRCGGICGRGDIVQNCTSDCEYSSKQRNTNVTVSGIAGIAENVSDCVNYSNFDLEEEDYGWLNINGIASSINGAKSTKNNCINYGNIRFCVSSYAPYVSSISGIGAGSSYNCENYGEITGIVKGSEADIGGICGSTQGITKNCKNFANITVYMGGEPYRLITNVGGIIGEGLYTEVANCFNCGNISVQNLNGTPEKWKNANVGGIIGKGHENNNNPEAIIENSYNTGNIFSIYTAGGIIGCASNFKVKNSYNTASVIGKYIAGGIFGDFGYNSLIENVYNIGNVTILTDIEYQSFKGNICGLMDDRTVINNAYSTGTNDISNSDYDITVVLESEKLNNKKNFTGFDFSNVWIISNELKRPVLKSNMES